MTTLIQDIFQQILDGAHTQIPGTVQAALDSGLPAKTVLEDGMIAAMAEVGRLV